MPNVGWSRRVALSNPLIGRQNNLGQSDSSDTKHYLALNHFAFLAVMATPDLQIARSSGTSIRASCGRSGRQNSDGIRNQAAGQ
jgi:hypothetical protein